MRLVKKSLLAAAIATACGAAMAASLPQIEVLATGGTIAGSGNSATGSAYTAGKVSVNHLVAAVPQLADGKIVIDGRYMIDSHEGNYRLYRIEGGTPSVIGIYQRPSSAIVDVIADSIRITHRHADTEDTVLEIQRLATVCRDTLNGMTK